MFWFPKSKQTQPSWSSITFKIWSKKKGFFARNLSVSIPILVIVIFNCVMAFSSYTIYKISISAVAKKELDVKINQQKVEEAKDALWFLNWLRYRHFDAEAISKQLLFIEQFAFIKRYEHTYIDWSFRVVLRGLTEQQIWEIFNAIKKDQDGIVNLKKTSASVQTLDDGITVVIIFTS